MALSINKRQLILLTNIDNGISKKFVFMKDAAEYLNTSHTQIRNSIKNNKLYKGHSIYLG